MTSENQQPPTSNSEHITAAYSVPADGANQSTASASNGSDIRGLMTPPALPSYTALDELRDRTRTIPIPSYEFAQGTFPGTIARLRDLHGRMVRLIFDWNQFLIPSFHACASEWDRVAAYGSQSLSDQYWQRVRESRKLIDYAAHSLLHRAVWDTTEAFAMITCGDRLVLFERLARFDMAVARLDHRTVELEACKKTLSDQVEEMRCTLDMLRLVRLLETDLEI